MHPSDSSTRPTFPPRPIADTPSLILSSLPEVLPASLRPQEEEPPAPEPRKRRPLVAAVVVAALALVGACAWLLWPVDEPAQQAAPAPSFTQAVSPVFDSDCANHAYGATKDFLADTKCRQLTRALYTSVAPDGRTVHSSVALVRMRSETDAKALLDLVRGDGTGSVNDLVREKQVSITGLNRLSQGGFAATARGADVVIVESDTPVRGPDTDEHKVEMKRISNDALDLGFTLT